MSIGMDLAIGFGPGVFGKWRESRGLEGSGLSNILWKRARGMRTSAMRDGARETRNESAAGVDRGRRTVLERV